MMTPRTPISALVLASAATLAACAPSSASRDVPGSTPAASGALAASAPPPRGCELPASQRTSGVGCYLAAIETLGVLDGGSLYWHLREFPSRTAAESARGRGGTVVEAFGKVLLYTIADERWQPSA